MICPNCNNNLPDGSTFCNVCGTRLAPASAPVNTQAAFGPAPAQEPAQAPVPDPVPPAPAKEKSNPLNTAGLICGISSICTGLIIGIIFGVFGTALGVFSGIAGIILSVNYMKMAGKKCTAGFVLSIIGFAISTCMVFGCAFCAPNGVADMANTAWKIGGLFK